MQAETSMNAAEHNSRKLILNLKEERIFKNGRLVDFLNWKWQQHQENGRNLFFLQMFSCRRKINLVFFASVSKNRFSNVCSRIRSRPEKEKEKRKIIDFKLIFLLRQTVRSQR